MLQSLKILLGSCVCGVGYEQAVFEAVYFNTTAMQIFTRRLVGVTGIYESRCQLIPESSTSCWYGFSGSVKATRSLLALALSKQQTDAQILLFLSLVARQNPLALSPCSTGTTTMPPRTNKIEQQSKIKPSKARGEAPAPESQPPAKRESQLSAKPESRTELSEQQMTLSNDLSPERNYLAQDRTLSPDSQLMAKLWTSTPPVLPSEAVLYEDLPKERRYRAQFYIRTLNAIGIVDASIERFQSNVSMSDATSMRLDRELASLQETAAEMLEDAQRQHDRVIREAAEQKEKRIKAIHTQTKTTKEKLEKEKAEHVVDMNKAEAKVSELVLRNWDLANQKQALEHEGGFQLGLDVGVIEERRKTMEPSAGHCPRNDFLGLRRFKEQVYDDLDELE
jgi:hypothetical protein